MTAYENLIIEAELLGAIVIEMDLEGETGYCYNEVIFINQNMTEKQKYCILSEEIGHFKTTIGNILALTDVKDIKQENLAHAIAIQRVCSIKQIVNAFKNGANDRYEIAEILNIPDKFFDEAIEYHRQKNGLFCECDGFILYFEPTFGIIGKKEHFMPKELSHYV